MDIKCVPVALSIVVYHTCFEDMRFVHLQGMLILEKRRRRPSWNRRTTYWACTMPINDWKWMMQITRSSSSSSHFSGMSNSHGQNIPSSRHPSKRHARKWESPNELLHRFLVPSVSKDDEKDSTGKRTLFILWDTTFIFHAFYNHQFEAILLVRTCKRSRDGRDCVISLTIHQYDYSWRNEEKTGLGPSLLLQLVVHLEEEAAPCWDFMICWMQNASRKYSWAFSCSPWRSRMGAMRL